RSVIPGEETKIRQRIVGGSGFEDATRTIDANHRAFRMVHRQKGCQPAGPAAQFKYARSRTEARGASLIEAVGRVERHVRVQASHQIRFVQVAEEVVNLVNLLFALYAVSHLQIAIESLVTHPLP